MYEYNTWYIQTILIYYLYPRKIIEILINLKQTLLNI